MCQDSLSFLKQQIGGSNPLTEITLNTYDSNGNRTRTEDALNRVATSSYDARNRVIGTVDGNGGQVSYLYDQLDQLVRVTDPRGLQTQYTYDGLGNLATLSSPDTGTAQYTYDVAGNLLTKADARSNVSTQSYDALNRITSQSTTNGPAYTYTYDQGSNGIGRLNTIGEGSAGSTQYGYDAFGRLTSKTQTLHSRVLTVGYGYAAGGKLNRITYPSGKQLTFTFDGAGRVSGISIDGVTLLNQVTWQPFGQPNGWVWSNGSAHQRSYDLDGRIRRLALPQMPEETQSFGYDNVLRLTSAVSVNANQNLVYAYDGVGNRTQEVQNGLSSVYTMAGTSNRLTTVSGNQSRVFTFNANGSVVQDNATTFTYDGRERMVAAGSTTYYVNALGQRIEKAGPGADTESGTRQFVYDEAGKLLGEYDLASGAAIAEHIYLNDWPVAVISNGSTYYVHLDHLGSPRAVTLPATDATVWYWDSTLPFGGDQANQNPSGLGSFSYNLRFPGQYFDSETSKHYNYFRDYDPTLGRYTESDPIGLSGGVNTYVYAGANPFSLSDPLGLLAIGRGCNALQTRMIRNAAQKVQQMLSNGCQCTSDYNGCVPCDRLQNLKTALDRAVVNCTAGPYCATGDVNGTGINIMPPGFAQKGCGCLASTLFHELLHNSGLSHKDPGDPATVIENKCMGYLCK